MLPDDLATEKIKLFQAMRKEMLALRGCLEKLVTLSAGRFPEGKRFLEDTEEAGNNPENDPLSRLSVHLTRIEEFREQIDKLEKCVQTREATPVEMPDTPGHLNSSNPPKGELPGAIETGKPIADASPDELPTLLRQIEEIHRENVRLAENARRQWADALQEFRAARRVTAYFQQLKKAGASGGWFVDRRY